MVFISQVILKKTLNLSGKLCMFPAGKDARLKNILKKYSNGEMTNY